MPATHEHSHHETGPTQGRKMTERKLKLCSVSLGIMLLLLSSTFLHMNFDSAQAQTSCSFDETKSICGLFLRPGVRDEFKSNSTHAWSHTLDTLRGKQGGDAQRRQLLDHYQDYAILASMSDSLGDFQFDIWTVKNVSSIRVYLPSNFTFAYTSSGYGDAITYDKLYSVWTDITNDYAYISVATLADDDPIAPGWDRIEIGRVPTPTLPTPSFVIRPGLHHIRLFQLRAPFTAGLYHIKVYVDGKTIGEGNFPIVIVKSALQPAHVTGLVLLQGLQPPTNASGRIVAAGATADGKYAQAIAYFGANDSATTDARGRYYRYWLFGLPAGTFDLTASASGFVKASSRISVDAGQSLTLDFELEKGVKIEATIWSKDRQGPIPWGNLWQLPYGTNNPYLPIDDSSHHRDILVRLLDQYEETVGYWASDDIDPPYGPPWSIAAIDAKRSYLSFVLKPSTLPSSSSYTLTLTDSRGLSSARLDGHVLADTADFVEGIGPGSYILEVQVTGYIMQESDDAQRVFTITENTKNCTLQIDLRRSSWIKATAMISDGSPAPISNSTLVVVAKSTDNFEKAVAAERFPGNHTRFDLILEGFNGAYNRRSTMDYQDYGLSPVNYYLEVYMADMAHPSQHFIGMGWYLMKEEITEIQLNAGPMEFAVALHLEACSLEFILRSIQVQQPPQMAPWTFPGAEIRVFLVDELGGLTATIDPLYYGLIQDPGTTNATLGWPIPGALPANSYGVSPYDIDNVNPAGRHALLSLKYTGTDPGPVLALSGIYPTRIEAGKYFVNVATLGYIQRTDCSVHLFSGSDNDVQLDLVQGAQIRVEVEFKHESMPTAFNGFVRVEVLNSQGQLIGASIYGQAQPNYYTLVNTNPGGGYLNYSRSNDYMLIAGPAQAADFGLANTTRLEAVNTFPSSTGNVVDSLYPANIGFINGQRASTSSYMYSSKVRRPIPSGNGAIGALNTWANWPAIVRSDANRLSMPESASAAFDVYGFYSYIGDLDSRTERLWANGWDTTNGAAHSDSGIRGSKDILDLEGEGDLIVRAWAFDPYGPDGAFDSKGPDGIFGTDDDYTSADSVGSGLSDFRAYGQVAEATNIEAPWGGAVTVHLTLEEQPSMLGVVSWLDMYGDLRKLAWAQVIERSPDGIWTSSATGSYRLWLSPGSHEFLVTTIGETQLWEQLNFDIVIAGPGDHTPRDVTLTTTGTPTPEFTDQAWAAVFPVITLSILLSKRRRNQPRA